MTERFFQDFDQFHVHSKFSNAKFSCFNAVLQLGIIFGLVIAQAVSSWLPTATAQVRVRVMWSSW
jgi:hypothetical protein